MKNRYNGSGNAGCVIVIMLIVCLIFAAKVLVLSFSVIAIYFLYFTGLKNDFKKLERAARIILVLSLVALNAIAIYLSIKYNWFESSYENGFIDSPGRIMRMGDRW